MSNELEKRARAVSAKVQNRLDILKDLISLKYKRSQIIEHINNKYEDWNVSVGTIDSYIRKAREQFLEDATQTTRMLKAEAATDLRFLMKKALEEDEISTALRCRVELSKLYALHGGNGVLVEEVAREKIVTPTLVQDQLDTVFNKTALSIAEAPEEATESVQPKPSTDSSFASLGL